MGPGKVPDRPAGGAVDVIDGAGAPVRLLPMEAVLRIQEADVVVYDEACRVAVLNCRRPGALLVPAKLLEQQGGGGRQVGFRMAAWAREGKRVVRLRAGPAHPPAEPGPPFGEGRGLEGEGRAMEGAGGGHGGGELDGLREAGIPYTLLRGWASMATVHPGGDGGQADAWRPLAGCRVCITRAREQAGPLRDRVSALGGEPVEFATIRFEPPPDWSPLDAALEHGAARYDWLVFTSANGVQGFLGRIRDQGFDVRAWQGAKVAAVGPATAGALRQAGLRVDAVPGEYRGEAVVEAMARTGALAGRRVALVRALHGRDALPEGLRRLGAQVDVLPAYQTVQDGEGAGLVQGLLEEGEIHVLTFTSPSTARHFAGSIPGAAALVERAGVLVACIGPVTAQGAGEAGFPVHIVPGEYTVPALVDAIAARWQQVRGTRGRRV